MKSMGLWEGLLDNSQKLLTNICFNIFAEGWVEPCYFPISSFSSGGFFSGIGIKFEFVLETTSLQSSLVWWNGCGKNFFIGRDFRKPIFSILGSIFQNKGGIITLRKPSLQVQCDVQKVLSVHLEVWEDTPSQSSL